MGKKQEKKGQASGCVIPGFLYIGPVSTASDLKFLQAHEITVILSIGKSPRRVDEGIRTADGLKTMTYHRLSLLDDPDADITRCVDQACEILDHARSSGAKVLVHCSAAISRSPTVVAAYLMSSQGYTLQQSLDILTAARPAISPNPGFLSQLQQLEAKLLTHAQDVNPVQMP
ncbi:dual specificity protein phosphatase family protein [Aspergillus lucknowensis]|uniref:protein-tyrosine-phosphatase n=1 Tax=Aspergillus lucknowensis TaxID=176173 RepID=A0ABR4LNJ6_9EURO